MVIIVDDLSPVFSLGNDSLYVGSRLLTVIVNEIFLGKEGRISVDSSNGNNGYESKPYEAKYLTEPRHITAGEIKGDVSTKRCGIGSDPRSIVCKTILLFNNIVWIC